MSQPSPPGMDEASRKKLSRIGGVALLASAILFIIYAAATFYTGPNPNANNSGVFGFIASLDWAASNYTSLTLALTVETLAVALILPGLTALYATLFEKDRTNTLLGSVLLGAGLIIFLSTVAGAFFYLNEANAYNHCNDCQPIAIAGAASTFAVTTSQEIASLFFVVGVILISWVMTRHPSFGNLVGFLGAAIGLAGVVGGIVLIATNNPSTIFYFTPSILSAVAIWEILAGFRLYRFKP